MAGGVKIIDQALNTTGDVKVGGDLEIAGQTMIRGTIVTGYQPTQAT